jgi:hypothetical protein
MKVRLNYSKDAPKTIKGMQELEKFVYASELEQSLFVK